MTFEERMESQWQARQPDWRGRLLQRFRWSIFGWAWGRYCYIVHPIEGGPDIVWWEWEKP